MKGQMFLIPLKHKMVLETCSNHTLNSLGFTKTCGGVVIKAKGGQNQQLRLLILTQFVILISSHFL